MSSAVRGYREFHGKQPRARTRGRFHDPKTLIFLGRAVKIEYLSNKRHGGGDGKYAVYVHKFETPVNLYMDETKKRQLYIIGSQLKVTEAGIEN